MEPGPSREALMGLTVHYVRDLADPASDCWKMFPPPGDLTDALTLARDGYSNVRDFLGAAGFRIVDETGRVIAEEAIAV